MTKPKYFGFKEQKYLVRFQRTWLFRLKIHPSQHKPRLFWKKSFNANYAPFSATTRQNVCQKITSQRFWCIVLLLKPDYHWQSYSFNVTRVQKLSNKTETLQSQIFVTVSEVKLAVSQHLNTNIVTTQQKSSICCETSTILCEGSRMFDPLTHFCYRGSDVKTGRSLRRSKHSLSLILWFCSSCLFFLASICRTVLFLWINSRLLVLFALFK